MNNLWKNNLRNIEPYIPGEQSKDKDIVKINANERLMGANLFKLKPTTW